MILILRKKIHKKNQSEPKDLFHSWKWTLSRGHFVYAPSNWETMLQLLCYVVSHWLGTYTKWSLIGQLCPKWEPASCDYTPRFNEVERGVYWYHLVRLSVCPSVDRIVSALYLGEFFKFVTLTLSSFDLLFLVSFLRCHCRLQFRMDSFHIWYKWSIA